MKTWIVVLIFLIVLPLQGRAQTVHKCINARGAVSYQSDPCPGGKAVKTWAAMPEPEPTNQELWRRHYAKQKAQSDSEYLSNQARRARSGAGPGTVISPSGDTGSRCEAAKRQRDAQVNDSTGYDVRRRWNDYVYDQCK